MSYGMFRLPLWSSVVGGNKVTAEDVKVLSPPQRKSPVVESTAVHNLKRKRTGSGEFERVMSSNTQCGYAHVPENPHLRSAAQDNSASATIMHDSVSISATPSAVPSTQATSPERNPNSSLSMSKNPASPSTTNNTSANINLQNSTASPQGNTRNTMDTDTLRETLETQLSLEILLKHDELRLIDQEIAKCQAALEQLRRCSEIPYPVSNLTKPSPSVSSGVGFSTTPQGGGRAPSSPAPWGVSDGPYSRHYSRWLLPGSRFDGGEPEPAPLLVTGGVGKTVPEGRTTRAAWGETGGPAGRPQRGSKGSKLQALSNGYPLPKDKAGPMIIKRKSDGQYVKLVCIDCRRDNFSSTQGFINHCRIAHGRSFASHDAAAQASGEPVEVDETGAVIGSENESSSNGPPGYVHPLIRAARAVDSNTKKSTPPKKSAQSPSPDPKLKPETPSTSTKRPPTAGDILKPTDESTNNTTFKASPQAPHLSNLMHSRGLGLDLLNIVDDALTKMDMDMFSSDADSDDDAEPDSKNDSSPLDARGSRLPARTIVSPSQQRRPGSQKGSEKGGRKPRPSAPSKPPGTPGRYLISLPFPQSSPEPTQPVAHNRDMGDTNHSPHTHQAPSLVSDDEELGARTPESPSPSLSESNADETVFDNIEVQDGYDGNESTTTGSAVDVGVTTNTGKHRSAPMSRATGAAKSKKPKAAGRKQQADGDSTKTSSKDTKSSTAAKKGNAKRQRRK